MKTRFALAAIALSTLVAPGLALANQPDVSLTAPKEVAEDVAADQLAMQLLVAITASQFDVALPADYVSTDPNYDPLADWSPD